MATIIQTAQQPKPATAHLKPGPWPYFSAEDIQVVSECLASGKVNYWTGQQCQTFEREYAEALGVKHTISLANGTLALELALYALGIGAGDEVIVTPRSFIASASCVVMRGAIPVFADVDRESQNMTAATIAEKLTPRTKAIILVHLAGWPCEMDEIMELARSRNIAVIEDCAQAHGAMYRGKQVGSIGHANAFSFCQDKIISTGGEGGLFTTGNTDVWNRAWSFKDHGKSYAAVFERKHPVGYRFLHESFGTNWRMLEMQAALGRRALCNLEHNLAKRREHAAILEDGFQKVAALRVATPPAHMRHAYYKYYVYLRPEALKTDWHRERITAEIASHGIPVFSGYGPMYKEKAFENAGLLPPRPLPVAQELGGTAMVFLVHPTMSREFMHFTADTAAKVLAQATR